MTEILEKTLLHYNEGNSNKFYEVSLTLEDDSDCYHVVARWGRCNRNWKIAGGSTQVKYTSRSKYSAELKMRDFSWSKKAKGYIQVPFPKKKKEKDEMDESLERFAILDI